MEKTFKYILYSLSLFFLFSFVFGAALSDPFTHQVQVKNENFPDPDTTVPDSFNLIYPIPQTDPIFNGTESGNPMYLDPPANISTGVIYDPNTNTFNFQQTLGEKPLSPANTMTFEEYLNYDLKNSVDNYWRSRAGTQGGNRQSGLIPSLKVGGEVFDRIFGGNTVDIRPQGSAELTFGIISNRRDDPSLDIRQRRTTNFDFQEKIQMSVIAKIGDKIEFKTNYNTEATFEFENKLKLKYEGKEDEIIKLIEAGDVTLPLNSTLITGSQSLFGIKTKLQFGKTNVTAVFSQQKSESQTINVEGGAETHEFSLTADQYEENKHFFVGQYFRENYDLFLRDLPIINSPINITKMEVWVTNIGAAVTDNRNIVAFTDIGERNPYNSLIHVMPGFPFPSNVSNDLMLQIDTSRIRDINTVTDYLSGSFGFTSGEDYMKIESARKLNATEYTVNTKLGFISLNTTLNSDQTLAVAYQFTVIGQDSIFQVGEFSDQGITSPKCLVVKLLKSTSVNTRIPMYKLMMKNVYSIGAYQITRDDFMLNILYSGNDNGIPTGYLTEGTVSGKPLIQVFNCDNLDPQLNPPADGIFDFIDNAAKTGGTVNSSNGRIYFPTLEPFGKTLRDSLNDPELADKYCYDSLYTMTKNGAQQYPDKNKFLIQGLYKSASGSEIPLNAMNVPQGSVKVTAGGIPLTENVDYTVDYTLGRVKIINEGILNSGTPIKISLENNSMFNIQTKRLWGVHFDHKVNKDLNLGATLINLTERPLTQKVNFGDEPISNTIWGMDISYQKESMFITKLLDKLPFYSTKAPSKITFEGEFAHFIPGHSKAVGKSGTSYIDDFEGSKSTIDLKNIGTWFLASTPQGQFDLFPEAAAGTGLKYGFNRSLLSWYIIDPIFYDRSGVSQRPGNVSKDEISRNLVRDVLETEVFPNKQSQNNIPMNLPVFNLGYYPADRGPYNYDVEGVPGISAGLNPDGSLKQPETRWGGIMRKIETTDFEATNVEYIEFWMMDPFTDDVDQTNSGQLYVDLGDISEDILRDSRKSFEQGLPTSDNVINVDTTIWGRVPTLPALVHAFDNNPDARPYQDVGYDGLNNSDELSFFNNTYLSRIANTLGTGTPAYSSAENDPSGDNYHYFRGGDYDDDPLYSSVLNRYKKYNQPDGNSPSDNQNPEAYPTQATNLPNEEDINKDNTLSEEERYYQYRIDLDTSKMKVGMNYIADKYTAEGVPLANGGTGSVTWYQFKIPVSSPDRVVGNIQDFKSIRFMRVFFKGFKKPVVCRMATFELVRSEWRKYRYQLLAPGEYIPNDDNDLTSFDISTVSIEENGKKVPIPYILPPDIEREINLGTTNLQQLNEQSMVLKVCNLTDGDARAAYKTSDFDIRKFKHLKMYIHAEKAFGGNDDPNPNNDIYPKGDLTVFVRMGSDFTDNYYEYEIPLTFTPWYTSATDVYSIWPKENAMDIELDKLISAKQDRNIAMREQGSVITTSTPYITYDGQNKITVVGMPNLSDVKALMIGVRNPRKQGPNSDDDGRTKCAEIWVNELRLTDFDEKGGWAATARVNATLADLGNVVISGIHSTAGFGSIEQKVNERQKETVSQYDIATNIELGKLLPKNSGMKIPMHIDFSEKRSIPEYNPLNPDVNFQEDLDTYSSQAERDSIKGITVDYTRRKNINFMNVRKEKVGDKGGKSRFYDISNFDVTYAYSELYHRNIDIRYDLKKTYRGGLGYNFSANPKPVRPLSGIQFFNKYKAFRIISDLNFYYAPKLLAFRTDMTREYSEKMLRNKSNADILIFPTYIKKWDWTRMYDFKYDLTQSIRIDFQANASAYVHEPPGAIDKDSPNYQAYKDSVREEILNFGTMNLYTQSLDISYNLPLNKIPIFSWLNVTTSYGGDFRWTASPRSIQSRVGNTIENSGNKQINGSINMSTLYNKIPYLKKLGQSGQQGKGMNPKGKDPRQSQNTKQKQPTSPVIDTAGVKKEKTPVWKLITDNSLRILTSLKNASITYNRTDGTTLPGFMPTPEILGNNWNQNSPGAAFVFGLQPSGPQDFEEWLSRDTVVTAAYMRKYNENLNARATLEPFTDFRIEITANRQYSENHQEYYTANSDGVFKGSAPQTTGNFSISFLSWNTAFFQDNKENQSQVFERLKEYRYDIAMRLAQQNPNWNGDITDSTQFPKGYGPTSQEVLMPAFLAAYRGQKPDKIGLSTFPAIPLPNWRITFNGLTRIDFIKKYIKTLNISHAYRSTYNIGGFTSNLLYAETDGFSSKFNDVNNYISEFNIQQVSIAEQFSPLLDIEMTWVNSLMTKIEIKKTRNLSLSFVNNQLTEVTSNEFVVGLGYRFKDVQFTVKPVGGGKKTKLKSDLNVKVDFSIKNNKTVLRRIDEDVDQISAGQKVLSINTSAEYMINQRFNVRFFFDKVINNPFISSQFPNSTTNGGISLRFTLAQ
ncbi:MAG: cell surface protein SprA [Bacteroidales bacterium]